jgi:hypothetical protein
MSDKGGLTAQDKTNSTIARDPVTGNRQWVGAHKRQRQPGYLNTIGTGSQGLLRRARRKLMLQGFTALDHRGLAVANAYRVRRQELTDQLGGADVITPAQELLIEHICRGQAIQDHIDDVLLRQPRLTNGKRNKLLPLVSERFMISRTITAQLAQLGLERRTRIRSLQEDLAASPELLSKEGEVIP